MKVILHIPPPYPPSPQIENPFGGGLKSIVPSLLLTSTKVIKDEEGKDIFEFVFYSKAELEQGEHDEIDELCHKWMNDPKTRLANYTGEMFEGPVYANQKQ